MNELPPLPGDRRKTDADNLRWLSIFHFIGAGLAVIGILAVIGHYTFLHVMFSRLAPRQRPPAQVLVVTRWLFVIRWLYLTAGAWLVVSGVLNVISGLCLRTRQHRIFSLVVAGINCLHVPLGTILGIFTMIALSRSSVEELYETSDRPRH